MDTQPTTISSLVLSANVSKEIRLWAMFAQFCRVADTYDNPDVYKISFVQPRL